MFKEPIVDIGEIKVGKNVDIEFPYDDIGPISRLTSPCDCSVPRDFRTDKKVVVSYTPNPIPKHLEQQGYYEPTKMIDVYYSNAMGLEEQQTLTFKAKVVN